MNAHATATDARAELEETLQRHAVFSLGKPWQDLSPRDKFDVVALSVRDRMMQRMLETEEGRRRQDCKRLYYLSIEFLIGQSLGFNLRNLGLYELFDQVLAGLGADLREIEDSEPDAALGNGGLGRLAACFVDSLATLDMPGYGYGINYEYGIFKQEISDGYQRELPDKWLAHGSPWQIVRSDEACMVPIYGRIEHATDRDGAYNPMWMDWKLLIGVPYDMLIPGYGGHTINYLRLYSARSSREFDMRIFNDGDYFRAVEQKMQSENITKVLYPSDAVIPSQELRLLQEYFLAACAVRDIVRRFEKEHSSFRDFSSKVAIQLNDTHPTLAIVELMRILVDEKQLSWEEAWQTTQCTFGYTNHTLSSEALEKWPVPLLDHVLPRHLQIVYEINRRFLEQLATAFPQQDSERPGRLSLVENSNPQRIRMVNLALLGSHSVNGVSVIHSELLKSRLLPDFNRLWPRKFSNKTNGISQRRWLLQANPLLADLICSVIGDGWITDLEQLRDLEPFSTDAGFQMSFHLVKRLNKQKLAELVRNSLHLKLNQDALFDVQVKRIHAYKRQLLNVLHILHEYLALVEDGIRPTIPRAYIFAGKAAPGYRLAKQIIKLIHNVGRVINNDPRARDLMTIVFIPDYRISLAEKIIAATDLGEQISTAGTEASGTGNMKMSLNGAVLLGTFDGANLEIVEEVGRENMLLFGHRADELESMRRQKSYRPREYYDLDPRVKRAVNSLLSRSFCPEGADLFADIYRSLLDEADEHFHLADLPAYLEAHEKAAKMFADHERWTRMSILNVTRIGKFSSDRAVAEYAKEIWDLRGSR